MEVADRPDATDLTRHHLPVLRGLARRYASGPDDADDLLHDILLKALTHLPHLRRRDRLGAWLSSIARREGARLFRREHRRQEMQAGLGVPSGGRAGWAFGGHGYLAAQPDEELERQEVSGRLWEALGQLPPCYRRTLRLWAEGGLTRAELARTLDVPETTVKAWLARGGRLLRSALRGEAACEKG